MLVSFSISNYKTYRYDEEDNNCLFMSPGRLRTKKNHIIKTNIPGFDVLNTAAIFGANSSGKTNLFDAMRLVKKITTKGYMPDASEFEKIRCAESDEDLPITFTFEIAVNSSDYEDCIQEYKHYIEVKPESYRSISELLKQVSYEYNSSNYGMDLLDNNSNHYDVFRYKLSLSTYDNSPYISHESIEHLENNDYVMVTEIKNSPQSRQYKALRTKLQQLNREYKHLVALNDNYNLKRSIEKLKSQRDQYTLLEVENFNNTVSPQKQIKHTNDIFTYQIKNYKEERISEIINDIDEKIKFLEKKLINDTQSLNLDNKIRTIKAEINDINKQLDELGTFSNQNIDSCRSMLSLPAYKLEYLISQSDASHTKFKNAQTYVRSVQRWFAYTLEILDTEDYAFSDIGMQTLGSISKILSHFDLEISKLQWTSVDEKSEIEDLLRHLSSDKVSKVKTCRQISIEQDAECSSIAKNRANLYNISFYRGSMSITKLTAVHNDNSIHDLSDESEGTRRLIELSSILAPSKNNKVYMVDELNNKLHPLVSKKYLQEFFDRAKSKNNKQLIFSSHEPYIFDTDLFRTDELWTISRTDEYGSMLRNIDGFDVRMTKELDRMYLDDGVFGGIPMFKKDRCQ